MPDIGKEPHEPPSEMDVLMERVLAMFPAATFAEDDEGQIVIYTDLRESEEGRVIPLEPVEAS